MSIIKHQTPCLPATLHRILYVAFALAGFLMGSVPGAVILVTMDKFFPEGPKPLMEIASLALLFGGCVGGTLLMIRVVILLPVRCRKCGGRAYLSFRSDYYECAVCSESFRSSPLESMKERIRKSASLERLYIATSILWRLPLLIGLFLVAVSFAAMAGEAVLFIYAVAFLKNLDPAGDLKGLFSETAGLMSTAAFLIAPLRGIIFLPTVISGSAPLTIPILVNRPFLVINVLVGVCGIYYGITGLLRESVWRLRQARQVFNIATSKARAAAVGLSEFIGTARDLETSGGPPGDGDIIYWNFSLIHDEYTGKNNEIKQFYLEDKSGRILVDPVGANLQIQRPLVSLLTVWLGAAPFEASLKKRVIKRLWPNREFFLKDGDEVYLLGNVEERKDAPLDAVGSERLIVRPTSASRQGSYIPFELIIPLRFSARRSIHDVFFLSDAGERHSKRRIIYNFWSRLIWGIIWITLSAVLTYGSVMLLWTERHLRL